MLNTLKQAMPVLKSLCSTIELTINIYPQTQRGHYTDPDDNVSVLEFITEGLVQTVNPQGITNYYNTTNTTRVYRIYVNKSVEPISYLNNPAYQATVSFVYNSNQITTQVVSFSDFRYNGWVSLQVVQSESPHHFYMLK